jgi:ABC-type sugar transport system substrate-binding protein
MRFAALGLALAAFAAVAPSACAQMDSSAPIVVKQQKVKPLWMKAEVIHADHNTLMVREAGKEMAVHTFTYGPKAAQQMQRVLDAGGYQRGDAIKIQLRPGQTVALAIKGKPSRPI